MRRRLFAFLAMLAALGAAPAGARVTVLPGGKVFRLDGGGVTYAIGVDEEGFLEPIYWGPSLAEGDPLPIPATFSPSSFDPPSLERAQEFPGQGAGLVTDPGIKAVFADGNRDLILKYRAHHIDGDTLTVEMSDIDRPIAVTLTYTIDPATGILSRQASVRNNGSGPVRIDQLAAATFTLPAARGYRLHFLSGRHAAEFGEYSVPLSPALAVLESRRGSSGHGNNPWFALGRDGATTEEDGPVWFGALAWSGSFRISAGLDNLGRPRIAGGFNPYDFSWSLRPGETLESPVFHAGYSSEGLGGASRLLHRFTRTRVLPGGDAAPLRPVLYNSWEATLFNVTEAGQMALAERAARLGVERFVIDDGWFGTRDTDQAGLGDWVVNPRKFPNGLKPLINRVHALGMSFGLWVEPEMVNRNSDLFRAHPDWILGFPGRPQTEARSQLVLNLARPEVRDWMLATLDTLVSDNDIQFLKWDYNRNWTEAGWPQVGPDDQQRVYVDYVRNLYYVIAELRRRHPGLEIEDCSGGGGRADLGMMALTDQVWVSDNTDAFDRLPIQDGFTRAYPAGVMIDWVTDSPGGLNWRRTTLDYRFLVAMQGALGIGADLGRWNANDEATARKWIAAYKTVRMTIQRGDRYRLTRTAEGDPDDATLYVAADRHQAVLFQMLRGSEWRDNPGPIHPRGLDPQAVYRVRMLDGSNLPAETPPQASGAWWMAHGLRAPLRGDFMGAAFVFDLANGGTAKP